MKIKAVISNKLMWMSRILMRMSRRLLRGSLGGELTKELFESRWLKMYFPFGVPASKSRFGKNSVGVTPKCLGSRFKSHEDEHVDLSIDLITVDLVDKTDGVWKTANSTSLIDRRIGWGMVAKPLGAEGVEIDYR